MMEERHVSLSLSLYLYIYIYIYIERERVYLIILKKSAEHQLPQCTSNHRASTVDIPYSKVLSTIEMKSVSIF